MEYNHERAVADGVNVGYDVYRIQTEVTARGGNVEKGSTSIAVPKKLARAAGNSSMKTLFTMPPTSTHFLIIDAVGVCESDETDSRPLDRQPTLKLDKIILGVALGKRDDDTVTTLAGRLARLDREIAPAEAAQIKTIAGKSISVLAASLLKAIDPDVIAENACVKCANSGLNEREKRPANLALHPMK
jgi:type I site-specific restriction endonuclease